MVFWRIAINFPSRDNHQRSIQISRQNQKEVFQKEVILCLKSEPNDAEPSGFRLKFEWVKWVQNVSEVIALALLKSRGIGDRTHAAKTAFRDRGGNVDDCF